MRIGSARLVGALALTAAVAAFAAGGASTATVDDTVVNGLGTELQSLDATGGAVMLELAGEPSAVTYTKARSLGASKADAGKAGKASKERNEQAQGAVLADLQSAGIDATPLYQVQSAYNGIAVQAAPGTIDELAALPGVAAVHVIPLVELDNHSSVPLIGALQAWGTYGKTGTGMSIAVIDTGIDYVHRDFGGSGSSADYAVARSAAANLPSPTSDNPAGFSIPGIYPSAKVVGGLDFAGDNYTRLRRRRGPRPGRRTRWTATATARTCPARPPARASTRTARLTQARTTARSTRRRWASARASRRGRSSTASACSGAQAAPPSPPPRSTGPPTRTGTATRPTTST